LTSLVKYQVKHQPIPFFYSLDIIIPFISGFLEYALQSGQETGSLKMDLEMTKNITNFAQDKQTTKLKTQIYENGKN